MAGVPGDLEKKRRECCRFDGRCGNCRGGIGAPAEVAERDAAVGGVSFYARTVEWIRGHGLAPRRLAPPLRHRDLASEAAGIELLMQRYDGRFAQPRAAVGLDRGDRSKVAT